ncbi:unnamed protein product [Chrysoparadoxa australica]
MSLLGLPQPLLGYVTIFLDQKGLFLLGSVCSSLRSFFLGFQRGEHVFPMRLKIEGSSLQGLAVENDKILSQRGGGSILLGEPIDRLTCYWEVRIDCFRGYRMDIGVASSDRRQTWCIDCWGRALRNGGDMRAYGCKMVDNDVIGVLLSTYNNTLLFFLGGVCLGTAFSRVVAPAGTSLRPYIAFPNVPGLVVAPFLEPRSVNLPMPVSRLMASKRLYKHRQHSMDGALVVVGNINGESELVQGLDLLTACVGDLKRALLLCDCLAECEYTQLALRVDGKRLDDDTVPLYSVVKMGRNMAQLNSLYMYVPHLIS